MAKWSVALFGHLKPKFYIQTKDTGITVARTSEEPDYDPDIQCWVIGVDTFPITDFKLHQVDGWAKRAEPGDIIAFKPWPERFKWTENETKEFLIVELHIPSGQQKREALCECEYDLNTYPEYDPPTFDDWHSALYLRATRAKNKEIAMRKYQRMTDKQKKDKYDFDIEMMQMGAAYPKGYNKKRRFKFTLQDLEAEGIDVGRMLDRDLIYDPRPRLQHLIGVDKLKIRKVQPTDGLNLIPPRTF